MNDLVVLVPDKNMEAALTGILGRKSLAIHPLKSTIFIHPGRDSGCLLQGPEFLRAFFKRYEHCLVLLDREGCGREQETRQQLESGIEQRLRRSGWGERAAAIVLDPELEIWVWSDSPHVPKLLGWDSGWASLRKRLIERRYLRESASKPSRPKEAMEELLRLKKRPRSSSIYLEMARSVGFERCQDAAFLKLKATLKAWFPA